MMVPQAIALAWSASGTTLAACEMIKGTLHLLRVPQSGDAIERIRMFTAHSGRVRHCHLRADALTFFCS